VEHSTSDTVLAHDVFHVQVERSYDCVARCQRRDTKQEAALGYELGNWFMKAVKVNVPTDVMQEAAAPNIALETAVAVLVAVFSSSITASFLGALSSFLVVSLNS
jgi:hypothetical protein